MTCSCGDQMSIEANNRDEAVTQYKAMMSEHSIAEHFAEKHQGQPVPPVSVVHAMIEHQVSA